ncbi:MAG: hypothetical protein PVSMB7_26600 [Chloroflexota bacterium]
MFRTWTTSADDAETVSRALEVHLNEFADEVVSVSYSVDGAYHVLAVYRGIEHVVENAEAVTVAERILEGAQE